MLLFILFAIGRVSSCAGTAHDNDPPPARQAALLHLLRQDCGACHGMTLKGGLGPSLLPESLRDQNETVLARIIRDGVLGTPMPPWAFEISEPEALWLVRNLKDGLDDQ
ncbi:MAG: cytochrome c [Alphaproteobacteria bacterium]|nr:cytochrome c [Alphaproteobacteria bacterium]